MLYVKRNTILIVLFLLSIIFTSCGSKIERSYIKDNKNSYEKPGNENVNYNSTGINTYTPDGSTVNSEKVIKDNVYLYGVNFGGLNEAKALRRIRKKAGKIDRKAVKAVLNDHTWTIKRNGKPGKRLNGERTLMMLFAAPSGARVEPVIDEITPGITSEELVGNIKVIGSYTTTFLDKSDSRVKNIDIACKKLNYKKIKPGEEFSFNDTLGKRTRKKGYEKAPIIKKTEDGPVRMDDYGGGICQIASTLYNAVTEAGIKVTERHMHSDEVKYVPKGKDATVSYGSSDFKFVNNRGYPVMIRLYVKNNSLTVNIIENRN